MKLRSLKNPLLCFILFALLPFYGISCAQEAFDLPQIQTKFLLHTNDATVQSGDWEYYLLSDTDYAGNYAVSLTENAKKNKKPSDIIKVPETFREKNVVGIWHNAFHACKAQEVKLHDKIKVIDFEAFLYSGITKIEVPYTVERIGDAAFYACKDLVYARFEDNDYSSTGDAIKCVCTDEVEEPEATLLIENGASPKQTRTDGTGVTWSTLTTIPSFCFFACATMVEFTPPSSITDIEWEAFHGCSSLTSVSFYELNNIRGRAFQSCTSLTSVSIPSTLFRLGTIEPYAFNHCGTQIRFKFNGVTDTWRTNHWNSWGKNDEGYPYNTEDYCTVTDLPDPAPTASSDWTEAVGGHMSTQGFVIGSYTGEVPPNNDVEGLLIVPEKIQNRPVIGLMRGALDRVAGVIRRLYLPKTLLFIDNAFFGDTETSGNPKTYFPNLKVISYTGDECRDWNALRDKVDGKPSGDPKAANAGNIIGRIDLHPMTDLAFIGHRAFRNLAKSGEITKIHLPYRLISVGDQAFSRAESIGTFRQLTEFTWDYREPHGDDPSDPDYEPGSRLETVGNDAFWKVGWNGNSAHFVENPAARAYKPTTLIFPKTFKYFGILSGPKGANQWGSGTTVQINDIARYNNVYGFNYSQPANQKNDRPGHTFSGCPLIKKVIFRGGESFPAATSPSIEKDTGDLVIPLQAFAFCVSLETIIIEERVGKTVTFHTQNADWAQSSCGTYGAGTKSDFRGDPGLQTVILPNRYTTVRFQDMAFLNAARAAIYFSGDLPGTSVNIIGNNNTGGGKGKHWPTMIGTARPYIKNGAIVNKLDNDVLIGDVNDWRTIGREDVYYGKSAAVPYKGYGGYCFYGDDSNSFPTNTDTKDAYNYFGLDQKIPYYGNTHYKENVEDSAGYEFDVEVGEGHNGEADSQNELVIKNKIAFHCDASTGNATAAKYLYNLRDASNHTTATIPASVTANGTDYPVTTIGKSCFTACFCEGTDGTGTVGEFEDLTTVIAPNSITTIEEYAFLRAYGVKNFGVATEVNGKTVYYMPSSLTSIGKNAFTFCNITAFRKIPTTCTFFENTDNSNYKICSVFSNNYSLRRITFKDGSGNEVAYNDKYTTATYASNDGDSVPFTTALYSTGNVTYKKSRLLLVLYRGQDEKRSVDATGSPIAATSLVNGKITFDGKPDGYTQPFLYGAYRMGSWIEHLKAGTATKDANGTNILAQPLLTGICTRTAEGVVDRYIHLHEGVNVCTPTNRIDLESLEGDVSVQPAFGYSNCTRLQNVELGGSTGSISLANGLFRDANNMELQYTVKDTTPDTLVLDLSAVNYKAIGSQTFKNNVAITKFIAPTCGSFTIGASAFEGCTGLQLIDLSKVTNITINAGAFKGCTSLTTIVWPQGKLTMTASGSGAFEGCTALKGSLTKDQYDSDSSLVPTALTFPTNMAESIGENSFKDCTSLQKVECADSATHPVKTIGASAFRGCSSLNDFDFDSFKGLETIGNYAFASSENAAGILKTGGVLELPSHIKAINERAFSAAPLTEVTFDSTELTLGKNAFMSCASLTGVYFTDAAFSCAWKPQNSWNEGVFASCSALTAVELPSSFNVGGTSPSQSMIKGSGSLEFYLWKKDNYDVELKDVWRNNGSTAAPCHFLVDELADVVSAGAFKMQSTSATYWKRTSPSDPHPIKLGKVVRRGDAYDIFSEPENGIVIFSNGYKLTSTEFGPIAITPTASMFAHAFTDGALDRVL